MTTDVEFSRRVDIDFLNEKAFKIITTQAKALEHITVTIASSLLLPDGLAATP